MIEPYEGGKRAYQLKISGKSAENDEWETLWEGETARGGEFRVPQDRQREWRFLRIDGYGNDENNAVAISELRVEIGTEKKEKNLYERLGAGEEK